MLNHIDELTTQGYDIQFGTNVLGARLITWRRHHVDYRTGHYYFTTLLLPALLAGAKSSRDGKARVVNTASAASMFVNDIDLNHLKDTPERRKKGTSVMYSQSKLVCFDDWQQFNPVRSSCLL